MRKIVAVADIDAAAEPPGAGKDVMWGGAGADRFTVSGTIVGNVLDRIQDFEVGGNGADPSRDKIDLHQALAGTAFTGATALDAFSQSYVYVRQHGTPGQVDFGTTVYLDRNGHAADTLPDIPLVDLAGIPMSALHFQYYNSNFTL